RGSGSCRRILASRRAGWRHQPRRAEPRRASMADRTWRGQAVRSHRAVSHPNDNPHDRLLWRLEQEELRALSWGRVDGAMTQDEVEALADEEITDSVERTRVFDELVDWHLILDVGQDEALWRTRFAESVRLLARNRQLMPNRSWRAAPGLVN